MKRNAIITIDATHAQVTQAFAKQARIFGLPNTKSGEPMPGLPRRGNGY